MYQVSHLITPSRYGLSKIKHKDGYTTARCAELGNKHFRSSSSVTYATYVGIVPFQNLNQRDSPSLRLFRTIYEYASHKKRIRGILRHATYTSVIAKGEASVSKVTRAEGCDGIDWLHQPLQVPRRDEASLTYPC